MMKEKVLPMLAAGLILCAGLALSGCRTVQPATSSPNSQTSSPAPEPPVSASESVTPQMTPAQHQLYNSVLADLNATGSLVVAWSGTPIGNNDNFVSVWEILGYAPADNGLVTVTAEIYGNLYLDPLTMQETIYGTEVPILTQGLPYSPQLALGRSVVELRDTPNGTVEPVSCRYEPYQSPGITYLKEQAAKNPPPADSPKLDVNQYDPDFTNFIWRLLMQTRYIESPGDITHADLAAMTGALQIDWSALPPNVDGETYLLDASLLELMPNLTGVNCQISLADYSVFQGMNQLELLSLSNMNDGRMATLRVGHTRKLHLENPDFDVLDLTNVNTDTLSMMSYSTAIRGFTGCDKIKNLYINSTRTDMRLVNAESFPNAEYLNLQFYSDFERVRDLSQLATFPAAVPIDLMLSYMACNDQTLQTLAGVPLRRLGLSPNNGAGNRVADPALVSAIPYQQLVGENYGYFEELTKESTVLG